MGIQGLLGYVEIDGKSVTSIKAIPTHISILRPLVENKVCIVDASALVHLALERCTRDNFMNALEIARGIHIHNNGGVTEAITQELIKTFKLFNNTCNNLLGCTPVYVFDGSIPPAKEKEKQRRIDGARKAFADFQIIDGQGKAASKEGIRKLSDSCYRTWEQTRIAVGCCVTMRVDKWIAPYEADAQIIYISRTCKRECFIACQDSDFLGYEVGVDICFNLVKEAARDMPSNFRVCMFSKEHKEQFLDKKCMNQTMFLARAILKGCDYTKHLHDGKSNGPLFRLRIDNLMINIKLHLGDASREYDNVSVLSALSSCFPNDKYTQCEKSFKHALNAFREAWVFDESGTKCITLSGEEQPTEEDVEITGRKIDDRIAFAYCSGEYNPEEKKPESLEAYGVCPLPAGFRHTYVAVRKVDWCRYPVVSKEVMLDFFGDATYEKGQNRTANHIAEREKAHTAVRAAKTICKYKWMQLCFSAVFHDDGAVSITGRIPRSQHQNLMQAYADISKNIEGKYFIRKGYCVCALGIEGKCVHVAALVWSMTQQGAWARANELDKYRHDPAVTGKPDEDDEDVVCTSRLGRWTIPTGDVKMDLTIPMIHMVIEDPHTIAERQDKFVEKLNGTDNDVEGKKRKIREGLCQKQSNRECMQPILENLLDPLPCSETTEAQVVLRNKHLKLIHDVAKYYKLN